MHKYKTAGGVEVVKQIIQVSYEDGINKLIPKLDHNKGVLLVSNFEYPGRYTRWDLGFINPPLQIITKNNIFEIEALNERGIVLLSIIKDQLEKIEYIKHITDSESLFKGEIKNITSQFAEEMRSKRPSIFSILRKIINTFYSEEDQYLGLYGAFGYDLAFQFEDIERCLTRSDDHRDLVLYLPDEILVVDHRKETSILYNYDFNYNELSTIGLLHTGISQQYIPKSELKLNSDHTENEYVNTVLKAKQAFKCGDLFEVVPSQMFTVGCQQLPSEVFMQLKMVNPSPYSFFINLGESEYLVGASPEMYVRVIGKKVETCPISGTIARGRDALEDASQILTLLNSKKDYSELTMCTDVDRNDKSRVCKPGSVKVIGRRHIEMYSRLIHT
ncbi:MAG: chorismate-binding protein, partial [Neisseriaceae bacterium]